MRKGRGVRVVGRLKQDRWQGEDEKMRERYVVVAEHVEFHPDPNRGDSGQIEEAAIEAETDGNDMVFEQAKEVKRKKK